jgi:hypothetical protein
MTTYVLVHGAFHGAWCWKKLVPLLQAAGHQVFAPSLTGLAERANLLTPDVGLSTHIQDIVQVIEINHLEEVILVGHSMGSMVIVVDQKRMGVGRTRQWGQSLPTLPGTMHPPHPVGTHRLLPPRSVRYAMRTFVRLILRCHLEYCPPAFLVPPLTSLDPTCPSPHRSPHSFQGFLKVMSDKG